MPVDQILKLILEQTAPVALAVFAMWMLNKTWDARLADAKLYASELVDHRRELIEVLTANTEAITRLCDRDQR